MDIEFVQHGIRFVANRNKAQSNLRKHGVSFEQAAEAFFDPFLKITLMPAVEMRLATR